MNCNILYNKIINDKKLREKQKIKYHLILFNHFSYHRLIEDIYYVHHLIDHIL